MSRTQPSFWQFSNIVPIIGLVFTLISSIVWNEIGKQDLKRDIAVINTKLDTVIANQMSSENSTKEIRGSIFSLSNRITGLETFTGFK